MDTFDFTPSNSAVRSSSRSQPVVEHVKALDLEPHKQCIQGTHVHLSNEELFSSDPNDRASKGWRFDSVDSVDSEVKEEKYASSNKANENYKSMMYFNQCSNHI